MSKLLVIIISLARRSNNYPQKAHRRCYHWGFRRCLLAQNRQRYAFWLVVWNIAYIALCDFPPFSRILVLSNFKLL